jgi:hypothetical protein
LRLSHNQIQSSKAKNIKRELLENSPNEYIPNSSNTFFSEELEYRVHKTSHNPKLRRMKKVHLEGCTLHGRGSEVTAHKPVNQYVQWNFLVATYPWMHCTTKALSVTNSRPRVLAHRSFIEFHTTVTANVKGTQRAIAHQPSETTP